MVWAGGVDADTRYRPFLTLPWVVLGQLAHDSVAGVRAGPCSVRAPPMRLKSVSRRFATGLRPPLTREDPLTWLKQTLGDHVKEVRLSARLTESPACLITDTLGITPALARMYRASGQAVPVGKRILELNPKHPLVTGLQQAHENRGADDSSLAETAELLYGTALLAEGDVPEDPAKFVGLLADRLARTV